MAAPLTKILYRISILAETLVAEIDDLETQSGYKHDLKAKVKHFKNLIDRYTFRNPDKATFKNKEYLTKRELLYMRVEAKIATLESESPEKMESFLKAVEDVCNN